MSGFWITSLLVVGPPSVLLKTGFCSVLGWYVVGSLAHPIAYLLDMAGALQSSIHEGLKNAQRGGA